MSNRSSRSRTRSRLPCPDPTVLLDVGAVPIILMTDEILWHSKMYSPEVVAGLHGYGEYEVRQVDSSSGATWRNGPSWFGLSSDDWRRRTIIVSHPLLVLPNDDDVWVDFRTQATNLAGRDPQTPYGDLVFT